MNNNASLEDLLLKFSFLYTGNTQLAKTITARFINENPTYPHFSKIELVQKFVKTCRAEYKKTTHLKQAIANVVTLHQIKKSSFISKLLSFSIVKREIVLLNFVADMPIKTISEILNMQEVKVRASMKKIELELIPYFPNDDLLVKEHIKLALGKLDLVEEERILSVDLVKQLSVFKWFTFTSSIVVIMLLVGAFFYISNLQKNEQALLSSSSNHLEEKDSSEMKNDSIENTNGSGSQSESPILMHMPDPILFEIQRYETFYNTPVFYSNLQTKYYVAMGLLDLYYVRKNMYEHNMLLSEQQEQSLLNRSRETYDLTIQNSEIKQTLADLNITEEEYIQKYLYPIEEYLELSNIISEKEIMFDYVENLYSSDAIPPQFLEYVKLTKEEYEALSSLLHMQEWEEVEENPPGLPFNIVGSVLKVSSKDGKFYIDNPEYFSIDTKVYGDFYYKYIVNELGLMLTRKTFKPITNYLENFKSDEEQENVLTTEILELLRALERSVEWELQD